jgi:hypothetical protein
MVPCCECEFKLKWCMFTNYHCPDHVSKQPVLRPWQIKPYKAYYLLCTCIDPNAKLIGEKHMLKFTGIIALYILCIIWAYLMKRSQIGSGKVENTTNIAMKL